MKCHDGEVCLRVVREAEAYEHAVVAGARSCSSPLVVLFLCQLPTFFADLGWDDAQFKIDDRVDGIFLSDCFLLLCMLDMFRDIWGTVTIEPLFGRYFGTLLWQMR